MVAAEHIRRAGAILSENVKFPHYYSEAYVQGVLDQAANSSDEVTLRLADLVKRYKPNPRPDKYDWGETVAGWDEFNESPSERRSDVLWETLEHFGFPFTNNPDVTTDIPEAGEVLGTLSAGLRAAGVS
jgi:hypothetical protein